METVFKVSDMNCGHCEAKIKTALDAVENTSASFDLENKTVSVTTEASTDEIIKVIADAGYTASL